MLVQIVLKKTFLPILIKGHGGRNSALMKIDSVSTLKLFSF